MRIAPFSAFEFYFYEFYKHFLFDGMKSDGNSFGAKLICGGITGMTASTLVTIGLNIRPTH